MAEVGFLESWFLWRDALAAAAVGGVLLAYLGFYVVLTRSAFVSAAVSQLAGLGVVIAMLMGAASEHAAEELLAAVSSADEATAMVSATAPATAGTAAGVEASAAGAPDTSDPFYIPPPPAELAVAPAPTTATTTADPITADRNAELGLIDAHELKHHADREETTDWMPLLLGVLLGVLGTALFALPRRGTRMANDAILAVTFVGASATTLVLAGYLTQDYRHVQATLFGDAVVASRGELYLLMGVAAAILVVHLLFRHRFLLIIFDPDAARAQGMATRGWGLLLGFTLGVAISVVTRGLGALPAFAFSVVPASAALLLTERLGRAFFIAIGFALAAAGGGYYVSFVAELPTGPTMVAALLLTLAPGGALSLTRKRA